VASALESAGSEHLELGLDVADEAQVVAAVAAVRKRFGRLDVVVNNAGLSVRKDALDLTVDEWDAVLDTNLRGAFLVARESARAMDPGGRVVSVSSTFARSAFPQRAAYAASKAGLEQLTRVLAVEWAPRGVTVNAIALTTVETPSRRDLFPTEEARQERIRRIPLGRLGLAADAIGALLLLASPAGAFVTGQTILVDGGFTL
jgi:NAD(P)-dependent dehydrogenase (short-subunit alcohol dehydrogenase family)